MEVAKSPRNLPQSYRVLLIEEDPDDAALIVAMLNRDARNFTITQVNSLQSAPDSIDALGFEAVLLNVLNIGRLNEAEKDSSARLEEIAKQVPTLVLTSDSSPTSFHDVLELGAQNCISKSELTARQLGRDIEHAVIRHRVETQLARQGKRASDASQAKTNFVSAMSHEIRTPLNALMGVTELLENSELDAEQSSYVRVFRRAGQSLLSLINGVLDLASIERGKFELIVSQFSIRELVEDVAENFAFAAHKKGLALIVDIAPEVTELVEGDAERIRQILINLVSNAIKFTPTGHVSLSVRREDAGFLLFEVRDSGIGVDRAKLQSIFEPFEQAQHDPEHVYGGTGLGLALCAGLAERMGGTVQAKATDTPGALMELRLPLVPKSEKHTPQMRRRVGRALVAVSSGEEYDAIVRFCGRAGVEVDGVSSCHEAIAQCRNAREPYDFLIADCRVPTGGGISIVEALENHPHPPRAMVLLPMDHRPGDTRFCEDLGASSMIKPIRERRIAEWFDGVETAVADPGEAKATQQRGIPKGLRILHADDSADNRLLVTAYLRDLQAEITEVHDGIDAVEKFVSGDFDLILMDVLMPRMDGLEATRRIREIERRESRSPTPIIALTANAFSEQIENCMRAGTSLHVAKPMSQAMLLDGLASVLDLQGPPVEAPTLVEETRSVQAIDPALIDPDILPLLPTYLERREEELIELKLKLSEKDFDALRVVGHNLKGTGAGYGIPEITEVGGRLEKAAQSTDGAAIAEEIGQLGLVIEAARNALDGLFS